MNKLSTDHECMLEALTHCWVPPHPDALPVIREAVTAALAIIRETPSPVAASGEGAADTDHGAAIADAVIVIAVDIKHDNFDAAKFHEKVLAERINAALASR